MRVTGGMTPEPRSRLSHSGLSSADQVCSPAETEAINDLKSVMESVRTVILFLHLSRLPPSQASERDRHTCVISGKLDPEIIANG